MKTRNVKIIMPIDRKNGILVEPKFKKVFSMFFLCFHVMKWKIHHNSNELEEFRLKMMILMKFDEKYAQLLAVDCVSHCK